MHFGEIIKMKTDTAFGIAHNTTGNIPQGRHAAGLQSVTALAQSTTNATPDQHSELLVNRNMSLLHRRTDVDDLENSRDFAAPLWSRAHKISQSADAAQTMVPGHAAPVGGYTKRLFDITIALTTLILMAPIMALIALLIYLTMGGPIFFSQQRIGYNRKAFRCLKFRSMVTNADERLAALLAQDPEAAHSWATTQKLKHDPRVTWLGHLLRKSSLDELPQLINILRGEMSCIGPRPIIQEELERYGPHARDYAMAKPGLTGLWQVNGRSNTSYDHRVECDRYYVNNWSLALDFNILFRTVPAVLKFNETS